MSTGAWGTSPESVAVWCMLPITWNRAKEGYRAPPKLKEGDAYAILMAAWPGPPDFNGTPEKLHDLADDLDEALSDLADARNGTDREEIRDARDTAESTLDEFYDALRETLHPALVAAENAVLDAGIALEREKEGQS